MHVSRLLGRREGQGGCGELEELDDGEGWWVFGGEKEHVKAGFRNARNKLFG